MSNREALEREIGIMLGERHVQRLNASRALVASNLYPQPATARVNISEEFTRVGVEKISTNSLNFGSSSQFQFSPGRIIGQIWAFGEVVCPRYIHADNFWFLNLLESITWQISGNSSINNVYLSGKSMRDFILAAVESEEKRLSMFRLDDVIDASAAAVTARSCFPVITPFSMPNKGGSYPFDSSTVNSNIVITLRWKPNYLVFQGTTAQTYNPPTAFNDLYLKCIDTELKDLQFSFSRAMRQDRSLMYSLPGYLLQSIEWDQTVTVGTRGTYSFSALPFGQVIGFTISAEPSSWRGTSTGLAVNIQSQSATFNYAQLSYNSQPIITLESLQEIRMVNALMKKGGNYDYTVRAPDALAYSAETDRSSYVLVLPLCYNIEEALEDRHYQTVRSYGGTTLVFEYDFDSSMPSGVTYHFTATPIFNAVYNVFDGVSSVVV